MAKRAANPGPSMSRRAALALAVGGVVAGCATGRANAQRPGAPAVAAMQGLAQKAVDLSIAPGVLMKVVGPSGVLYEDVRGFAHMEANAPLAGDSLFRIYSMTKPLTTAAALRLVEAGLLRLDDPVSKYIPAFAQTQVFAGGDSPADMRTEPVSRQILVRDLMRHTAGLTYRSDAQDPVSQLYRLRGIDHGGGEKILPMDGSAPAATLAEHADRIAAIPLVAQPGTRFTYGGATDVLGRVIEVAAGERLRDALARLVFQPLGMQSAAFEVSAARRPKLTAAYIGAAAPRVRGDVLDQVDVATLKAGRLILADPPDASPFAAPRPIDFGGAGVICTADDYLKFAGNLVSANPLLRRGSVDSMRTNALDPSALQAPGLKAAGLGFGAGLATFVDPAKAPKGAPPSVAFWGGAASTIFWIDPQNRLSGVIMSQVFGGDFRAFHVPLIEAFYAGLETT